MGRIATGITIGFGTSGFNAELIDTSLDGESRPKIKTSHQGSTVSHSYRPGKLVDPGDLKLDIAFGLDEMPPITADPETITITFPADTGESAGGTIIGTGFVTDWNAGLPLEERQTGSVTIAWASRPTYTGPTAS